MRYLFLLFSLPLFLFADCQCQYIYKLPRHLNYKELQAEAKKAGCAELLVALRATDNFFGDKKYRLGIRKHDFLQTAFYIERALKEDIELKNYYINKKDSGLKYVIEHDPETNQTFIVLDHKEAFVGEGAKKTVYKTILYCQHPRILARSEQSAPMNAELRASRALKGAPGVMKTYAFTMHKRGHKNYTAIYSDLYSGTFKTALNKRKLSLENKALLITDILKGLESMHSRNLVHRDLHSGNYLTKMHKNGNGKKMIRAVIADLGRTIEIEKVKRMPAQGSSRLCPPEGFNQKELKGEDYFATDIYAIGCIFHTLLHDKRPEWLGHYLKSDDLSQKEKKERLVKQLKEATDKRREILLARSRQGTLSTKQDLELLILKMLYTDPKKRATAALCLQEAERILERLKNT